VTCVKLSKKTDHTVFASAGNNVSRRKRRCASADVARPKLFVFDLRKSAVLLTMSEAKFAESTEEISQVCSPDSRSAAADTFSQVLRERCRDVDCGWQ
jgi:hypothetical protein